MFLVHPPPELLVAFAPTGLEQDASALSSSYDIANLRPSAKQRDERLKVGEPPARGA